jgi:type VI secretion system protein ImpH
MATSRRRKSLNLVEQLQSEPHRFDFFQAVRLLERAACMHPDKDEFATDSVGALARPDQEAMHFTSRPSLAFNGTDVTKISQKRISNYDTEDNSVLQWQVEVAMMGLTGSQGVMPHYLSEIVLSELRKKSSALKDYFDLFNHRTISMFYEAWQKYHLAPNYERSQQSDALKEDIFTDALLSLSGIGLSEQRYRSSIPDEHIAGFSGHFGRTICSAESLRSSISGMFGLNIEIDQFQGQWYDLPSDVHCRMPCADNPMGTNNQLGVSTVIGARCYQAQNKFSVIIRPVSEEEFMALAPGSKRLEELKSFIKLSVGGEQDFDLEIKLSDDQIPLKHLFESENYRPLLGWNTHTDPDLLDGQSITIKLSQDIAVPDDDLPLAL